MNITYREYTDADRNTSLDLVNKLAEHAKQMDPFKRIQNLPGYAKMAFDDMLKDVLEQHGKIWFAEDDGKIVAHILGVIRGQSEKNKLDIGTHKLGEVLELYIEEDYRRQGIGNKLLSMMEEYFKKNSCDSMWISVFAPNEPAHNLYHKFGFMDREIGMLKNI